MKRILFRIVLLFAAFCVTPLDGAEPALGQAARRESAPDNENLESLLREELLADHDVDVVTEDRSAWREAARFKKDTSVSDERFHAALMKIYREAEATAQAKNQESQDMQVLKDAERWMRGVVFWLGACEDVASKMFLLDLASDTSKGGILRIIAVASYLRVADAKETRDILLRFLAGDDRMNSQARSSILEHAHTVYQEAELGKKMAILESLYVALANEDTKWLFRVYDRILSQLSPQYANSEQRRDILKRLIHAKATCKADEYAMVGLENTLRKIEKANLHTTINTNLSALKERDFSQPLPEEERIAREAPPNAPDATDAAQEKSAETGRFYALTAIAGLLAVFVLWFGLRRKRGPA